VQGLFVHENVLVVLVAWYSLLTLMFSVAMGVALWLKPDIQFQGAVIGSWIGVPIAGAVSAAIALSRKNK